MRMHYISLHLTFDVVITTAVYKVAAHGLLILVNFTFISLMLRVRSADVTGCLCRAWMV